MGNKACAATKYKNDNIFTKKVSNYIKYTHQKKIT